MTSSGVVFPPSKGGGPIAASLPGPKEDHRQRAGNPQDGSPFARRRRPGNPRPPENSSTETLALVVNRKGTNRAETRRQNPSVSPAPPETPANPGAAAPGIIRAVMNSLPEKYRNRTVNYDVMAVLNELPDNCVDLIYGDPDYNVGMSYDGWTFTVSWNEYIDWYVELARECLRVLRADGNLFFINYPRQNAWLRVKFLDDHAWAVHDYAWVYSANVGHSKRRFTTAHRSILHAVKSPNNRFYKDRVAQPYRNLTDPRILKRLSEGHPGRMPYSRLNFNLVKNVFRDKADHPCQNPTGLSELLLKASTVPGDTAFILFGGSGSEVVQAKKLGLTYLTCELQPRYCDLIESRLRNDGEIEPENNRPGRANRSYDRRRTLQGVREGRKPKCPKERMGQA